MIGRIQSHGSLQCYDRYLIDGLPGLVGNLGQWIARNSRFRARAGDFRARRKRRPPKRAADGRAMGGGWLRSIRALRLVLTQPLSHVTMLNPYYFNVKRSLSKPADLWDRHWHPMDWSEHTPKPSLCVRCTRPSANLGCQSTELAEGWIQKTQSASHITCSRTRSASAQPFRVHGWASFQKVHPRFTLLTALHLRWHRPASAPPRFWKGR